MSPSKGERLQAVWRACVIVLGDISTPSTIKHVVSDKVMLIDNVKVKVSYISMCYHVPIIHLTNGKQLRCTSLSALLNKADINVISSKTRRNCRDEIRVDDKVNEDKFIDYLTS